MRILFLCNEYPPDTYGGIGSFTKLMATKLNELGHNVAVIGYSESKNNSLVDESGVKVYRLAKPMAPKNRYLGVLHLLKMRLYLHKHLNRFIKDFNPDLLESFEWSGPLLCKTKNVKTIVRLHGSNTANNEYLGHPKNILYFFEKRTLYLADYIISVSNHVAKITQDSFKKKYSYKTIYNGVDTTKFKMLNEERNHNKLLLVGRMHPYKGFEYLFQCIDSVFKENDSVYLDIICTVIPVYKNTLLEMVSTKYHHRINFLGRIPNEQLVNYYNDANLLILPSKAEAFPIIPLESMACGTPVIMSNRFSAAEIIDDGVNGFLVKPENPKVFSEKILFTLNNQHIVEDMRIKCRQKIIDNFDQTIIMKQNIDYYKSILNE